MSDCDLSYLIIENGVNIEDEYYKILKDNYNASSFQELSDENRSNFVDEIFNLYGKPMPLYKYLQENNKSIWDKGYNGKNFLETIEVVNYKSGLIYSFDLSYYNEYISNLTPIGDYNWLDNDGKTMKLPKKFLKKFKGVLQANEMKLIMLIVYHNYIKNNLSPDDLLIDSTRELTEKGNSSNTSNNTNTQNKTQSSDNSNTQTGTSSNKSDNNSTQTSNNKEHFNNFKEITSGSSSLRDRSESSTLNESSGKIKQQKIDEDRRNYINKTTTNYGKSNNTQNNSDDSSIQSYENFKEITTPNLTKSFSQIQGNSIMPEVNISGKEGGGGLVPEGNGYKYLSDTSETRSTEKQTGTNTSSKDGKILTNNLNKGNVTSTDGGTDIVTGEYIGNNSQVESNTITSYDGYNVESSTDSTNEQFGYEDTEKSYEGERLNDGNVQSTGSNKQDGTFSNTGSSKGSLKEDVTTTGSVESRDNSNKDIKELLKITPPAIKFKQIFSEYETIPTVTEFLIDITKPCFRSYITSFSEF